MDLSFNLAPSYRDLKDTTSRQNFDDTVEQKRVIDLRACHIAFPKKPTGHNVNMLELLSLYQRARALLTLVYLD